VDDDEDESFDLQDLGVRSSAESASMANLLAGLRESVERIATRDGAEPKLQVLQNFLADRGSLRNWGSIVLMQ
jgi:hypothetical protein